MKPSADFNPRSPHGERPAIRWASSIRVLFQSTLPARGATWRTRLACRLRRISIHAPRTGSDIEKGFKNFYAYDFNPRSPHGERQDSALSRAAACGFQSTLPARGATRRHRQHIATYTISIHAPRTGSDPLGREKIPLHADFNPRSPHGERQRNPQRGWPNSDFNPRSPHGERPLPFDQPAGAV